MVSLDAPTPIWPAGDRIAFPLGRSVLTASPFILILALIGWIGPRKPLLAASGTFVVTVLLGFIVGGVTVSKNPDLTENVTLQELVGCFPWYGPVYFSLARAQALGALSGLVFILRGVRP